MERSHGQRREEGLSWSLAEPQHLGCRYRKKRQQMKLKRSHQKYTRLVVPHEPRKEESVSERRGWLTVLNAAQK